MVIEHQREHCFWVAQRFQRAAIQALTLKTNCRHNGKWERLTHDCSPAIDEKYLEPFHNAQTIARNASRAGDRVQFAPSYACRRSEERRVGKECRSGRSRTHKKKKRRQK